MPNARALRMPSYSQGAQRLLSGDGGGGTTNHIEIHSNGHNFSALDSDGMDEILSKHGSAIADEVADRMGRMGQRENYR